MIQAGTFLTNADQVGELVVGLHDAARSSCATWPRSVQAGAADELRLDRRGPAVAGPTWPHPARGHHRDRQEAGTNAVEIARAVIQRFDQLSGIFIPRREIRRDPQLRETADQKARS